MATVAPVPILISIADISESRKVWFCDVWGVLHDGVTAFQPALQACHRFRERGGEIVLISNSPRPSPGVVAHLDSLSIPRSCFDALVTSGDVTRELVRARLDKPMFHLGPDRDKGFFEGLPVRFTSIGDAAVVVCTGLFDDERETPEDYDEMLRVLASREVPMICANPDLIVERGNKLLPCAGALAARYATLGQTVIQAGKPYHPIYEVAFGKLRRRARPDEILALGDGIDTDIKGAFWQGIDAVYIASRVHIRDEKLGRTFNSNLVEKLFANRPFRPRAAMAQLLWS